MSKLKKNLIITPRKNKSPTHPNPGANVGYVDENLARGAQKMAFSCGGLKQKNPCVTESNKSRIVHREKK